MTKIKICGITNAKDAKFAAELGADYLGFNFYIKSPRHLFPSTAKKIIGKINGDAKIVGIFVNESIASIKKISKSCGLDFIQLSGDEDEKFLHALKEKIKIPIIKSFRIKGKNAIHCRGTSKPDYILIDSYKKKQYGGTGQTFDLRLAKKFDSKKLFLAGGLDSHNVKLAIAQISPYAVDVCSGIESSCGIKDHEKMKKFVEAAK